MTRTQASTTFERIIGWSLHHPLPAPTRYAVATLLLVLIALVRAVLVTVLLPYLLFVPVVLLITLTMGKNTGLYATWASAFLAALTLIDPDRPWTLSGAQWSATLLYALVITFVTLLAAEVRAAFQRSRLLTAELAAANERLLEQEQQLRLVNQELGHRLKNQLSIVQAVAGQTLRQASDTRAAHDALSFRLAALGRTSDMLTAAEWRATDLHMLTNAAFAGHPALAERFRISGPRVRFDAQLAFGLTLAFHELMTNATKYGALSNDSGHVDLSWSLRSGADGREPRFHLKWQEVGGPPVQPPTRRGFGSVMIERSLRSYFRGETAIRYEPAGLIFEIDAPFDAAQLQGE